MMRASIICLLLICSLATDQQQLNFGVKNTVQSQLDAVLTALTNELRLYGTSFQDNTRLQRQIDFSYDVISILLRQLRPYNSVVQGRGNSINGTNDIVLGSFNNVHGGGNNWIFTNYFTGKASGDLILDKYRVQMDKKHLTSTRPDLVVFPLNTQQSEKYSKYVASNNLGSNTHPGVISLFKLGKIASQQINSYGIQYQSPQKPQLQPPKPQLQFPKHNIQPPKVQVQPSQFQFQPSRPFGGFQVSQQPTNNNQRGNNNNSGFVETQNNNFGGFTVGSGFSPSSNTDFPGFTRV